MVDLFIEYLPEIITVLSILLPTLPAIIVKVLSDQRTVKLLDTFKLEQINLRKTASSYQYDAERLTMELQELKRLKNDISIISSDIELIGRQLGIKPRKKEE